MKYRGTARLGEKNAARPVVPGRAAEEFFQSFEKV
jgi:hypothetical protein